MVVVPPRQEHVRTSEELVSMKIYVFPADVTGCGHFRLIWPANVLRAQGHDVTIVGPATRDSALAGVMDSHGNMVDVRIPADADLMVFQRVSHRHIAKAIKLIRQKGVAVAVDMDDDLTCIDPRNPAFLALQPGGVEPDHDWRNTLDACRDASAVVVSTPALLKRYASHGRGYVFDNYVPDHYFDVPHFDSATVGWAGSVHSHPTDLQVMGASPQMLAREGVQLAIIGSINGVREAWSLDEHVPVNATGPAHIEHWPTQVATLGIGVAPLADTKFNAAKSWLKMLEYAALGIPAVGSPRAEYVRLNKEHRIGMLAKDGTDWYRKVKRLVDDASLRYDMGQAGLEAAKKMSMSENAWKLAEIWTQAVKNERGKALGVHSRR